MGDATRLALEAGRLNLSLAKALMGTGRGGEAVKPLADAVEAVKAFAGPELTLAEARAITDEAERLKVASRIAPPGSR